MLYRLQSVKDDPLIVDYYKTDRNYWKKDYPYSLYLELQGRNYPICSIELRRTCDRHLKGDVILEEINKCYAYNYHFDPEKSWEYHHYREDWFWVGLNFEFEADSLLIKMKYPVFVTNLPEEKWKPEHSPLTNPHITDLHHIP